MTEFLAVIMITILAVISPGADFAIVTKNSYLYGRSIGVLTSIGIALGVLVHVAYTLLAVAIVMEFAPNFLTIIKYLGAFYLIYIGYKTFTQKPVKDVGSSTCISSAQALRLSLGNSIAIGDAFNDFTMLSAATYGYLFSPSKEVVEKALPMFNIVNSYQEIIDSIRACPQSERKSLKTARSCQTALDS